MAITDEEKREIARMALNRFQQMDPLAVWDLVGEATMKAVGRRVLTEAIEAIDQSIPRQQGTRADYQRLKGELEP